MPDRGRHLEHELRSALGQGSELGIELRGEGSDQGQAESVRMDGVKPGGNPTPSSSIRRTSRFPSRVKCTLIFPPASPPSGKAYLILLVTSSLTTRPIEIARFRSSVTGSMSQSMATPLASAPRLSAAKSTIRPR